MAQAHANLGYMIALTGKSDEGLRLLLEAGRFYEESNALKSPDAHLKRNYAETLAQTGKILERKNNRLGLEAHEIFRRSSDLWQDLKTRGVLRRADFSYVQSVSQRLSQ